MSTPNHQDPIVRPALHSGDLAPDFLQWSSDGPIRLYDWLGDGWGIVLASPCPPAIAPFDRHRVALLGGELARRGVKAIVLRPQGAVQGNPCGRPVALATPGLEAAPVIVNPEPGVAAAFGLCDGVDAGRMAAQWAILIGPDKVVRAVIACPADVGCPLAEIVQVLASVQGGGHDTWPLRGMDGVADASLREASETSVAASVPRSGLPRSLTH